MKPRKILLATDLSARCDRALDRAVLLAGEWGVPLVALHALQETTRATEVPSWRRPADPASVARARLCRDLGDAAGGNIEIVVERGEPAACILQAVERLGCDLVVTGVARDESLGRALSGTTVERLARKASVPLLIVKARPRGPYRSVVVATDFSDSARSALQVAVALLPSAAFTLFHAFSVAYEGLIENKSAAREDAAERARAESRAFLASAGLPEKIRVETLCEYGEIGQLLQELVEERGIDLVAVGTEGRGPLAKLFMDSIALRLVADLPADVLLVRKGLDAAP